MFFRLLSWTDLTKQDFEVLAKCKKGDIVTLNGKNWKITKKTTTAISVEPYYWWNRLSDYFKKGQNV